MLNAVMLRTSFFSRGAEVHRKLLMVFWSVVAWCGAAQAQELQKNGLPCVAEICLGDGIDALSKVQWDRAKNPFSTPTKPQYTAARKLRDGEVKMLQAQFRGDLSAAGPFLSDKMFDALALPVLARVSAACAPHELIGTFTTAAGNPTRVGIALIPDQTDTSKQQWTVISITRNIPAVVTEQQKSEARAQLAERYQAFDLRKTKNAKPGEGRMSINDNASFGFYLWLFRGVEEADRMKQHPQCGGGAKVKLD